MTPRKCKGCGGQVQEDQARVTFEEFFDVYCEDCAGKLRAKQESEWKNAFKKELESPEHQEYFKKYYFGQPARPKASQGASQEAPQRPQANPQDQPWTLYRQGPDGPIFKTSEKAQLPKNAIFRGYIVPQKGGPTYQLFKFPPKIDPAALDPRARQALQAGGFIF